MTSHSLSNPRRSPDRHTTGNLGLAGTGNAGRARLENADRAGEAGRGKTSRQLDDQSGNEQQQLSDSERQQIKRQHFKIVRFMFEASAKLRMEPLALATAARLYHQFFRDFRPADFDRHTIATTCLYLAGKIEEQLLHLTDIINVCHRILFRSDAALDIGSTYWALRDSVIQCELFLTRALHFQLSFTHPHKYLLHYLNSLSDWLDQSPNGSGAPIARTSWALLCDSYHGDVCLDYPPQLIAVSALYLALQCHGTVVPHNDEAKNEWWKVLVDDVRLPDIKKVVCRLIDLYDLETTAV